MSPLYLFSAKSLKKDIFTLIINLGDDSSTNMWKKERKLGGIIIFQRPIMSSFLFVGLTLAPVKSEIPCRLFYVGPALYCMSWGVHAVTSTTTAPTPVFSGSRIAHTTGPA